MLNILISLVGLVQAAVIDADGPENATEAFASLEGDWQGQLEYRDYQSGRLQAIPLRAEFEAIADGATFLQRSVFTDVASPVLITTMVNVDGGTVSVANSRTGRGVEAYDQTVGALEGSSIQAWTMTLTRVDQDDGRPAAIREVMLRDGNSLIIIKEVDFLDDGLIDWIFRNRVTLHAR